MGMLGCRSVLKVLSLLSCVGLCDPVDCSPPGSSVPGIFQARILEWVPVAYSGELPTPLESSALAGRFFTTVPPGKPDTVVGYLISLQAE